MSWYFNGHFLIGYKLKETSKQHFSNMEKQKRSKEKNENKQGWYQLATIKDRSRKTNLKNFANFFKLHLP